MDSVDGSKQLLSQDLQSEALPLALLLENYWLVLQHLF